MTTTTCYRDAFNMEPRMDNDTKQAAQQPQQPQQPTKFYRPLGNRVLVKRDDAITVTAGGLHLPATAQSKSDRGVVRYVGPGGVEASTGLRLAVSVKPGDVVIFPRSAIELEVGGEKLVMLQEPEIFAVEFNSAEAAAAFGGGHVEVVGAKARRRRSDAGVKRGKRVKGDVVVDISATPEQTASAIADATISKVIDAALNAAKESA